MYLVHMCSVIRLRHLFESYVGDPVTIRLVTPADRRRSHTFHLHGHRFRFDVQGH